MSYITTFTKKHFDPINIDVDNIEITDIAHALSLLCRANGHFKHFYSVAQHSLNCAKEAKARGYSKRVQLGCLLHDASEAYLSDVTRPMKAQLPKYLKVEEKLQNAIFNKWINPSLTEEERKLVFEIDDAVLYHEFLNLIDEKISDDEPKIISDLKYDFFDFSEIESKFISRFKALIGEKENRFVGVDWMKGKWLAVELHNNIVHYDTFTSIKELCDYHENADVILIDVPIGLPENTEQAKDRPDQSARDYLKVKNRKSSIFNVPFRQMVYAENKEEFKELNVKLGAKVSSQGFGIVNCIKDVDEFLNANPEWQNRLLESHPECAFQALNNGQGLDSSKHSDEGIELRSQILSKYVRNVKDLLMMTSSSAREDVLDALCLAVTAKVGYKSIPENPKTDSKGLKMQISVANL